MWNEWWRPSPHGATCEVGVRVALDELRGDGHREFREDRLLRGFFKEAGRASQEGRWSELPFFFHDLPEARPAPAAREEAYSPSLLLLPRPEFRLLVTVL